MYQEKYLKYKMKYTQLKKKLDSNLNKIGGGETDISGNLQTDISGNTGYDFGFFNWF